MNRTLPMLAVLSALAACSPPPAPAVQALDPWCRPAADAAYTAACYVTLTANTADRLISVTTPLAERVDIHATSLDGGVARMTMHQDGVPLPRDRAQTFRAGADHLMLIAPKRRLAEGETVPLTLTFEKAPPVTLQAAVRLTVR